MKNHVVKNLELIDDTTRCLKLLAANLLSLGLNVDHLDEAHKSKDSAVHKCVKEIEDWILGKELRKINLENLTSKFKGTEYWKGFSFISLEGMDMLLLGEDQQMAISIVDDLISVHYTEGKSLYYRTTNWRNSEEKPLKSFHEVENWVSAIIELFLDIE